MKPLLHTDMLSQKEIDALNVEVKGLLIEHDGQTTAETEIDTVIERHGLLLIERDENVALLKDPKTGRYATVWYESIFGQTSSVHTDAQYDESSVGFDRQRLGWGDIDNPPQEDED